MGTIHMTLALAVLGLAGCGAKSSGAEARAELREVVCTVSAPAEMIAAIAVGPEHVERLAPDARPGPWSPDDADLGALVSARRVLLMGAEFEPWAQRAGLPPSRTITLSEGLAPSSLLATETVTHTHGRGPAHSHGGQIPTTWTDPELLRMLVHEAGERLAGALVLADTPEASQAAIARRQAFEAAAEAYAGALEELKAALDGRRLLAVDHGFEYLAAAAGSSVVVALLEVDGSGARNDHAASILEQAVSAGGHAGVLLWPGAVDAAFAEAAQEEFGLRSVAVDLGVAGAGATALERLTASVRALGLAVERR